MLTQRQELILQAIVRQFTVSGQPVGSKLLAQELPIKVSSATIRNEMVVLEHEGLVKKEHSSSGRVPSKKGYRYYVDYLLDPTAISENDSAMIHNSLGTEFQKIDEIVSHSAEILSNLTSYTAFTLKPEQQNVKLSGFRLVPLGNARVLAILVTDSGEVESQAFTIPKRVEPEAVEAVIRLINDQLVGLPLTEVIKRLQEDIPVQITDYLQQPEGFLRIFDSIVNQASGERFYVGGRFNLLGIDTHQDAKAMKAVYELLDQSDRLSSIIDTDTSENGITVKIGSEIAKDKLLDNYSLITAKYQVDQFGEGIVAVLGPTTMSYSRTIGLVDAFRHELAKRLLNYYHHYYDS
ncbi:heat-inducible transcriptional repressor HrcA [Lactobacillus alvi]|uniref:Heat-inducible transcription repressor HrcA n=1 Tax=Limosilactobacillus alvi TaxID=990412 RepID=A0ABS2EMT3_9LACO|nr:heat-inducible transcriptional repressor HrcA [Limosilactobacillus alvi]MBM6753367.1 heat-inducible transcriptional repressor HrcA [Limosilactobacillus alvi]